MTPKELFEACEGREYISLVSPDGKRPLPRVQAELLCCNSMGGSVWLYKTKSILRALNAVMTLPDLSGIPKKSPGKG